MITNAQLPDRLARLKQATGDAIGQAAAGDFPNEAINWGDLHCQLARYVIDDTGAEYYQVVIEEASPSCYKFNGFIGEKLMPEFGHVEVITEW